MSTAETSVGGDAFLERELRASIDAFLKGTRSWPEAVDLGLPGMAVPADDGGLGLDRPLEAVAFEALARGIYGGPLFASALALPSLGHRERRDLALGARTFTLAWIARGGSNRVGNQSLPGCIADADGSEWTVSGAYDLVPSVEQADAVVALATSSTGVEAYLVNLHDRVQRAAAPGLDPTRPSGSLVLDRAPAERLVPADRLAAVMRETRTRAGCLLASEALGVGNIAVEMTSAYVKQRHAFGRALASFQAVAHQLAEAYTALQVARGVLDWALAVSRAGHELAPLAASAARATAAEAAVAAAERAIQLFGGMGFTWDAGLHSYLRRAQWISCFEQPPTTVFAELAGVLSDRGYGDRVPTTELLDTPAEANWRARVRAWIDENLESDRRGAVGADPGRDPTAFSGEWARRALLGGMATLSWPREYGGDGRSAVDSGIAAEEIARAHPRAWEYRCAIEIVAPAVMRRGSPEQRSRVLASIRAGERWAQGFSEPDAGSDLAALQTKAVPDGDGFRLDGIKVWITAADRADHLLVLARTSERRSKGISCFLVDVRSAGITVSALRDITGGFGEFGEVIFDNVYVAADDLLGEIDGGWQLALDQLDDERRRGAFEEAADIDHLFDRIIERGWRRSVDAELATRLGRCWTALTGLKLLNRRATRALDEGITLPEGLVTKLVFSEVGQQVADLTLDALGVEAVLGSVDPAAAAARHARLSARAFTIYAGSTEIMRTLIAEQILGLPRSR